MGAFGIFAFVLTGIYLVYYMVIICMDLFAKKGKTEDFEEEFNVADPVEQEAIVVKEDENSPTGFVTSPEEMPSIPLGGIEAGEEREAVVSSEEQPQETFGDAPEAEDPVGDASVAESDDCLEVVEDGTDDLGDDTEEDQMFYEALSQAKEQAESVQPFSQEELLSADYAALLDLQDSNPNRVLNRILNQQD